MTDRVFRRRKDRHQAGASTVEFAVLMPVVVLLVLVVLQLGLWYHARAAARAAAQEGARSAAAYLGSDDAGLEAARAVLSNVAAGEVNGAQITVDRDPAVGTVTVRVEGHSMSLVPWWELGVHVTAKAPVERLSP